MPAQVIRATQRVNFQAAATEGRPLTLEMHDKFGLAPAGKWPVRLYPPVAADVSASVGSAELTGVFDTHRRPRELVNFRNSTRASPQYPITRLVNVLIRHPLKIITPSGFQNVSLSPSDFHLDDATGEIVCSQPVYGPILVDYDADFRLIYYTPARTTSKAYYGGQTIESGTVYAWYDGQDAELAIPYLRRSATLREELYTAYSHIVANSDYEEGSLNGFELPDGWDDPDSIYSLKPTAEVPDPGASATWERPHRVGEYSTFGVVYEANIYQPTLTPYRDLFIYHPKVWARFAPAPEAGSTMEDGYQRAIREKDDILADLAKRFRNFQGEAS